MYPAFLKRPNRPSGDEGIFDEVYRQAIYEKRYTFKPTDIVVDVGAHAGFFTWKAAQIVSQVYAFEPAPDNFQTLTENCGALKNVSLYNRALGSYRHTAELGWSPYNSGGHSLYHNLFNPHDRKFPVRVVRLDAWLQCGRIDFIKIDAEGAEAEIIKGAYEKIDSYRPAFAMEIHSRVLLAEVKALLEPLQYKIYTTGRDGLSTFPDAASYGMIYAEFVDD